MSKELWVIGTLARPEVYGVRNSRAIQFNLGIREDWSKDVIFELSREDE